MLTNKGIGLAEEFRPKGDAAGAKASVARPRRRWPKVRTLLIEFTVVAVVGLLVWRLVQARQAASKPARGGDQAAQPVVPGIVAQKDVPIFLDGLGTVQALNTVTVRARVDGQIEEIAFTEGQDVHQGDLLVRIDPAPFRTQLAQVEAKQKQDEAQLANARRDLERYADLIAKKVISSQQYDAQRAMVDQLTAAVQSDQAAVENARVQLGYTTITAPIDGRTGIRTVDQGNLVRANDTTGVAVITQLQPISLVFTLPEQYLRQVHQQTAGGKELKVLALDRDNTSVLDEGVLSVIDNQIDTATGTIRMKATFPNRDFQLWPGQFINARLLVETREDTVVVPAAVIQRGPEGPYAFVIKDDQTVELRPVKVDRIQEGNALIESGLKAGERIVVDGQYRLQPGTKVRLPDAATAQGGGAAGHRPARTE